MVELSILGGKEHFCGEIITFWWWMITFEGPQCMWTNPSKKIQAGSDLGQTPPIQAMPVFWEHMVRQLLPNKCYSLLQRNNRTDSNYIQSHPNISRRQSQIFISLRKIMIENHFSQRSNCFPFWSSSGLGLDKKIRILLGTNAPLWAKRQIFEGFLFV